MVAHPLRVESARCAVRREQNKIEKKFLVRAFRLGLFCGWARAPQYSLGANGLGRALVLAVAPDQSNARPPAWARVIRRHGQTRSADSFPIVSQFEFGQG